MFSTLQISRTLKQKLTRQWKDLNFCDASKNKMQNKVLYTENVLALQHTCVKEKPDSSEAPVINDNKEIVSFQKNAKPFDETSLPSNALAKYVLEINAGLSDEWNIEVNDRIEFDILNE